MQGELEWSILDVEEEEWNRHVAGVDVAATARGLPNAAPARAAQDEQGEIHHGPAPAARIRRHWRALALSTVGVALLLAVLGYLLWRTAEDGIAKIEAEVAGAAKLENLRTRDHSVYTSVGDAVESVELRGDAALVQTVITYTLPGGTLLGARQAGFYARSAKGWQRSEPLPVFWGHSGTLDTPNVHFIFGERDREAVEHVAPTVETLYTKLMAATGEKLTASGSVTVEVVAGRVLGGTRFDGNRLQVTSPLLFAPPLPGHSRKDVLVLLLSDGLCEPMLAAALRKTPVKPQWKPLLEGFDCVRLGPGIDRQVATAAWTAPKARPSASVALADLLDESAADGAVRAQPVTNAGGEPGQPNIYVPGDLLFDRPLFAANVVGFIAALYGLEALPRLLHGIGEYDDWETLAPAVFGISADELNAAWHAAASAQ